MTQTPRPFSQGRIFPGGGEGTGGGGGFPSTVTARWRHGGPQGTSHQALGLSPPTNRVTRTLRPFLEKRIFAGGTVSGAPWWPAGAAGGPTDSDSLERI